MFSPPLLTPTCTRERARVCVWARAGVCVEGLRGVKEGLAVGNRTGEGCAGTMAQLSVSDGTAGGRAGRDEFGAGGGAGSTA